MNTNELRKLNAELESIQQNMIHYMNNQNQEDRLTDSTNRITNIAAQLKSLNKLGFQSYSIAINMQILIIQERIKKYGEVEKPNLKEVIIRATEHIEDVRDQFFKWYHSRYTNPRRVGSPKMGYINIILMEEKYRSLFHNSNNGLLIGNSIKRRNN